MFKRACASLKVRQSFLLDYLGKGLIVLLSFDLLQKRVKLRFFLLVNGVVYRGKHIFCWLQLEPALFLGAHLFFEDL